MSLSDPLGDMLTRIRNAYGRKKSTVSTPASRLRARVLDVLKSEGYIRDYSQTDFENGKSEIEIELKYFDGNPVVREISRVSKPGRRVYVSASRSRRSPTASASPSFRPRRASWPTTKRASRTSAAKFSARSSDRRIEIGRTRENVSYW